MLRLISLFILSVTSLARGQTSWTSPCPDLFHYNSTDGIGQWIGDFTLHSEEELIGIWIRMVFDPAPTDVESEFGFIKPQSSVFPTSGEYLLRKTNHILKPSEILHLTIKVKYNSTEKIPLLVGFRLNGDPICPEDKIIDPSRLMRISEGIDNGTKSTKNIQTFRKKRQTMEAKPEDWISPCPNLFYYDLSSIKPGEWSGFIILRSEKEMGGVWIRLTLDPRPKTVEADFVLIDPKNSSFQTSGEYLIRKTNEKLMPGDMLKIRLKITYNQSGAIPLLVGFRLNGDPICPDDKIIDPNRVVRPDVQSSTTLNQRSGNQMDGRLFIFPKQGGRDFLPRPSPIEKDSLPPPSPTGIENDFLPPTLNDKVTFSGSGNQQDRTITNPELIPRIDINNWESPCPSLFTYDRNSIKEGEWSGDLTLMSEEELGGIWVRLTLDPKPITVEADLGVIDARSSVFPTAAEFLIRKPNTKLPPGEVLKIRLKVKYFPENGIPLLIGFRLNGDPVCPDDKIIDPNRIRRPETLITSPPIETTTIGVFTPPKADVTTTGVFEPPKLESPCPTMFTYETVNINEWTGIINLVSEEDLGGVWVRLTIDPKPLSFESDFGTVDSRASVHQSAQDYLIRKTNQRLGEGQSLKIRIKVKYDPSQPIPLLIGYRLNGDPICPDDKIIDPTRVKRPNGAPTEQFLPPPELFTPPPVVTPDNEPIGNLPELFGISGSDQLESPCPDMFSYNVTTDGEWTGVISISSEEELSGIWVRLTIDPKPLTVESDFGTTDPRSSIFPSAGEYLIRKTNEKLSPGQTLRINLKVKYERSTPVPLLVGFRLNGDPVCPDDKIIDPTRIRRPNTIQQITPPPLLIPNRPTGSLSTSPPLTGNSNLESPCPDMFYYDSVKFDEWTGVIKLTTEEELGGIWVRLTIDPKPLSFESDFGSTDPRGSVFPTAGEYLIRKTNEKLSPGETLQIRVKVKFDPSKSIPVLIGYRLNGDPVCPDDKIIDPTRVNRPNVPSTTEEYVPPPIVVPVTTTTIDYSEIFQGITERPMSLEWESPCPDYFEYDRNSFKTNEWSGVFTITAEEELGGIWIRLTIDPKPLTVKSDFGAIDPRSSTFPSSGEYLIRKTNQKLSPGESLRIRITVGYDPSESIPVLVGFRLNGDPVCPDDKVIDPARVQRPVRPLITTVEPTTYRPPLNKPNIKPIVSSISNTDTNLYSPCPNVFNYEPILESNRWFGRIRWTPDQKVEVPHILKIIIDNEAYQLGNWYGETVTTDNREFIIFGQKPLNIGQELNMRFFIRYNMGVIPKLKAIIINDKTICGSIRLASSSEISSEESSIGQSYQINRFKNYILIKRGTKTTFIKVDNPNLPIIIL